MGNFAECTDNLGADARLSEVAIGKHRGFIGVSRATRGALVEIAYGGDGSESGRPATGASSISQRMSDRVAELLATAAAPRLAPYSVELLAPFERIQDIALPDTDALSCEFALEWNGAHVGPITLCLPIAGVADIENSVTVLSEVEGWRNRLERTLSTVRVPVRCVLGRPTLPAGQVAGLQPGAVIPIRALSEVTLIAAGYRIAKGSAEIRDGQAVVVVKSVEAEQ